MDFWAPWCAPCRALAPMVDQFSKQYKVKVVKLNIDENIDIQNVELKTSIMSIPTLVIIENGVEIDRIEGLQSRDKVEKFFAEVSK